MPSVNWDVFEGLPGAADRNFEMLCRALIRRHYGQFGQFCALLNQPGVEFHLNLNSACSLGAAGRWFGWQCRWYRLPSGRAIGKTRRDKIVDAIAKTEKELPGVTDWVLWTRHPLTKDDQIWFYGLTTKMTLHAWTAAEVEEHLSGDAEILRGTYFAELVLTPDMLAQIREVAIAPIRRRWHPEVHQVVQAERHVHRILFCGTVWEDIDQIAERLVTGADILSTEKDSLPNSLASGIDELIHEANVNATSLGDACDAIRNGDYEILRQRLTNLSPPARYWNDIVRFLRSARQPLVLDATNVLADLHAAYDAQHQMLESLSTRVVAIVADAGCGKTQLSAQITAAESISPSGVLLHGADLHASHSLDNLAKTVVIQGRPVSSFDALVAAVDAAGQRASRRLPLVIDGLSEAEEPRRWRSLLASLNASLQAYSHVLVVCTLRSAFVDESLPDDLMRLEIPDFGDDASEAIERYFEYYKIDPTDAYLPLNLLRHPLTLRIFCEVTNPDRKRAVGIEQIPGSLTALFDRYLDHAAKRVAELAPKSQRYYPADVRSALDDVGIAIWEERSRSVDQRELRCLLRDNGRSWDRSIVRLLEDEGILIRRPGDSSSYGHEAVVFDLLAGHVVADALIARVGAPGFKDWINEPGTRELLFGHYEVRHPLSNDIFRCLVGLAPFRMQRQQLWKMLDVSARSDALYHAAWLEGHYLDSETVAELAAFAIEDPRNHRRGDLLNRLWNTRSAIGHPLNAEFLDRILRPLAVADRDLRWSEWIRYNQEEIIEDLLFLEVRWAECEEVGDRDHLRLRWIIWLLTSTVRLLRDHATRAIYCFGCVDPKTLFALTIESLEINDPYVSERMLAASYGVAMSLWADPNGDRLRDALPAFVNELISAMWAPDAPYATRHCLMQEYALGIVRLGLQVQPDCVEEEFLDYLTPPFGHIPSPFRPVGEIDDSMVAGAETAIHMDFGNYTIGRLIPNRGNYDFEHREYRDVRRQIECRVLELGYSPERFAQVERLILDSGRPSRISGSARTERYGKKYSWIAYFEMYGMRLDQSKLPDWRTDRRTSDVDIDPSFPKPPLAWQPTLPDPFNMSPTDIQGWLANGPTPDYSHLLEMEQVDCYDGPWILLSGYIEQSAVGDGRRVFTFLRGLLAEPSTVRDLISSFEGIDYPGNNAIPPHGSDHYTFAGEIPSSLQFGAPWRDAEGKARRQLAMAFEFYKDGEWSGIEVEIPDYEFAWESYHSELNQVSEAIVPAPALCERLGLLNRRGEWDYYNASGEKVTVHRTWKLDCDRYRSSLLYLRRDLLDTYAKATSQSLVWLIWGERGFDYATTMAHENVYRDVRLGYSYIHRRSAIWHP